MRKSELMRMLQAAEGRFCRVDKFKTLGNGQVPAVAARAFCDLKKTLELNGD